MPGKKKGPPPVPLRGGTVAEKKEAEKKHEEEEEFDEDAFQPMQCITLSSNDGYDYIVELRTAMISQKIRNMIYGGGNFEEAETKMIRLPIPAKILERIIEYWHYRSQYSEHLDQLPKFDIDPKIAIEMLEAADYLQT